MKNTKVKYSFAQWCRDNKHEDWLDLWDYELNNISPDEVAYRSGKKYWFKCPRGMHESEEKLICQLTDDKEKRCFCKKCHSFGQYLLDTLGKDGIILYWSDKNTVNPFDISFKSNIKIWIKCTIDGHPDYKTTPYCFAEGERCPICCNNKIIKGINDIGTLRPDLIQYFENKDEAYIYGLGSNIYTNFICPICQSKYIKRISHVANFGLSCKKCGDHISYSNKFIYEFLSQLNKNNKFDIVPEHVFGWSEKAVCDYNDELSGTKKYDFVININDNVIIENYGLQHYQETNFFKRSYEIEHENDIFKYNLALANNIQKSNYIILDCRYSNVDWIKKSIMSSALPSIFEFSEDDIDWGKCELATKRNVIQTASELWRNGTHDIMTISKALGVSPVTVRRMLQVASRCKLCDYGTNVKKPILCLDNNYVFSYSVSLMNNSKKIFKQEFSQDYISKQARKSGKNRNGIHLSYITREEFDAIKKSEPWRVYE